VIRSSATLWKGRLLHFKGVFFNAEEKGKDATANYLAARVPSEPARNAAEERLFYELIREVPPDKANDAAVKKQVRQLASSAVRQAQEDATYWLGLVTYAMKDYPSAVEWLAERVLPAKPASPWKTGAAYNLGRTYEALGRRAEAIRQYRSLPPSALTYGQLVRARWLEALPGPK
jgi:hypothetical protein